MSSQKIATTKAQFAKALTQGTPTGMPAYACFVSGELQI
jgi:hypothetical protein